MHTDMMGHSFSCRGNAKTGRPDRLDHFERSHIPHLSVGGSLGGFADTSRGILIASEHNITAIYFYFYVGKIRKRIQKGNTVRCTDGKKPTLAKNC